MRERYGPELAGRSILPLEVHLREGAALGINEAYSLFTAWIFKNMPLSQQRLLYAGI